MLVVGCTKTTNRELVVDKNLCIHRCVKAFTYNVKEIDGSAVEQFQKICIDKFNVIDCCKSNNVNDYYKACIRNGTVREED